MSFLKRIMTWIEFGEKELIEDFGLIHGCEVKKENFTCKAQLLRDGKAWVLRLNLQRYWGNHGEKAFVDCYFKKLEDIRQPFLKLIKDVEANVKVGAVDNVGIVEKGLISISSGGKIIRSYGRIDNHPHNEDRFHSELFLSQQDSQYWMLISIGKTSKEWSKWPIEICNAICILLDGMKKRI